MAGAVEGFPLVVQGVNFVAGSGSAASVILLNGVAREHHVCDDDRLRDGTESHGRAVGGHAHGSGAESGHSAARFRIPCRS